MAEELDLLELELQTVGKWVPGTKHKFSARAESAFKSSIQPLKRFSKHLETLFFLSLGLELSVLYILGIEPHFSPSLGGF